MKTNAIIRIVIFSLVILLLLAVLGVGLGIGSLVFEFGLGTGDYISGSGSVPAAQVQDVKIEWASGSIKIIPADSDEINFFEEGYGSENQKMVYSLNGDTLTICYSKPGIRIGFMSTSNKDLTVTVPKDWICSELSIDAASTSIEAADLTVRTVDLDCASSNCRFSDCNFSNLDVDAASGDIYFSGTLDSLDCDAASATISAALSSVPKEINLDGASANLDITLPAECGFTASMDTLSGRFTSDFDTTISNGRHVYGDGYCRIDVDGAFGDVTIRKGN